MRAGQIVWHGARQSPRWSERRSSSAVFRASLTLSVSDSTRIPSRAAVAQEGTSPPLPSSLTTQTMQEVEGFRPSTWQRAGMSIPSFRAASRTVFPSSTSTSRPSIVSLGIFTRP